ncbi:hypothetical protein BUY41_06415 [Staphylococcus cohnii]|nr:hypothetical protein BZ166_01475 [Staphylococcus cohnii]PTF08038.1 hypothetical protein BUY41_06415 [Staphylococcus cohnii]PTF41231.1 hypothetical protein BUY29_06775 [Staphylococcus cohnii]RIM48563.1 hypothetical protein BUY22_00905 [Staphylococcus cohnii]
MKVVLERYVCNYHNMVDTYKNLPSDMDELQYMNLESIVKGITEVYNNTQTKVQQIIQLSLWGVYLKYQIRK